jgi:uroporphyrinogen decarboxylase
MLEVLADVGFSIINCGPGIQLTEARKAVGRRACLSGNVDPILTLMNGTPEAVRADVRRILQTISLQGGHLLCSGEMVPRATPEANVRAFIEEARTAWKDGSPSGQ